MSLGNNGLYTLNVLLTVHRLEPKAFKAEIHRNLNSWFSKEKLRNALEWELRHELRQEGRFYFLTEDGHKYLKDFFQEVRIEQHQYDKKLEENIPFEDRHE